MKYIKFLSLLLIFVLIFGNTIVGQKKYNEAPMLAELVKQGKLPPVEQRLPEKPLVVKPIEEVGQYGGTWRRIAVGGIGDAFIISNRLTYENLLRWSQDIKGFVPNVAEKWKITDDGRTFTIYLRKGIKWSDGTPFTADDIMFWYQDVILNKELTPSVPSWLIIDGEPPKVEKIDSYTIRFTFRKPYGLFLHQLASPNGLGLTQYPAHYLKQFHPKYTPLEQIEKQAKAAGFQYWYQLFSNKQNWQNTECPRIWAWVPKTVSAATNVVIAERNPYYWKVDTAGNQLPYIDRIRFDVVSDIEALALKVIAGEVDMQERNITWDNYPLYMQNREKGGYRVLRWTGSEGSNYLIMFNLNNKDPVLRKLFENKNFRIALSLAINREEVNKLCYLGLGKPRQASLISLSPYYEEKYAKAYAEYDPEKANKILDSLGLKARDKDGFRLRPDGKTLTVTIEYAPIFGPWRDVSNLVKSYWEKVGVKVLIKEESRELFAQRAQTQEYEIGIWGMDRCIIPTVEPLYWMPFAYGGTPPSTAVNYYQWYTTRGKEGEEPPKEIKRLYELYDLVKTSTSETIRTKYVKEIMRINAENVFNIGIVGELPAFVIIKNNFRNVPETGTTDWILLAPGYTATEQYFIKQ